MKNVLFYTLFEIAILTFLRQQFYIMPIYNRNKHFQRTMFYKKY